MVSSPSRIIAIQEDEHMRKKQYAIVAGAAAASLAMVVLTAGLAMARRPESGVPVGGMLLSFRPRHVSGADKNTNVCPLCQYPNDPAIQVWINNDTESNVAAIASDIERLCTAYSGQHLKAFVVDVNAAKRPAAAVTPALNALESRAGLRRVALVFVTGGDLIAARDNQINTDPAVKNTVFVYKKCKVAAKFVNLRADSSSMKTLDAAVGAICAR
jgi:hypothetical protein